MNDYEIIKGSYMKVFKLWKTFNFIPVSDQNQPGEGDSEWSYAALLLSVPGDGVVWSCTVCMNVLGDKLSKLKNRVICSEQQALENGQISADQQRNLPGWSRF